MIVGAGLAGLIAAHVMPGQKVVEAAPGPKAMHGALLRFRSNAVAEATGVEFRAVTVRKGIWEDGWRSPAIDVANRYARKVVGKLIDRSIWDVVPVTRWVAPEDLYERLVVAVGSRIEWGAAFSFSDSRSAEPIISTAPMPVALKSIGMSAEFSRAPITVLRFRVPGADVFQTVYFPTLEHSLYRASITKDLLICEFAGDPVGFWEDDLREAFALTDATIPVDAISQEFGKIAPVDEAFRRAAILALSQQRNVYSLGRFATWRNILLDDVVHDVAVIKRLISSGDYDKQLYYGRT